MKKGLFTMVFASTMLGAATMAFAGAYGEPQQPEEIPAPPPAPAVQEVPPAPKVMREFSGFVTDAETTRGIWAEIGSVYGVHYFDKSGDVEAVNTYAHISYGTEMFEVGALMPYLYVNQENGGPDDNDFGDLKLWGKVMPLRLDNFALGGGLSVSFPTGGDNFGLDDPRSDDEFGFEPFLTMNFIAGPTNIRATGGYHVTTEPSNLPDDAYNYSDLNVAVLAPIGDMVVVRGEITHNHLQANDADPVSIYPGVDVSIPVGSNELLLRPTVGVGIIDAPNWQVGLGIAFNAGI